MNPTAILLILLGLGAPQDETRQAADDRETISDPAWIGAEVFNNLVFLPAKVNGNETSALLDSGAGMTCVSAAMATTLGLEGGFAVVAQGAVGPVPARMFSGVDIEVGDVQLRDVTVLAIDFSTVEQHLGRPLPVILVLGKRSITYQKLNNVLHFLA